ncbi:MAG: NAD(P)H-dependent flavin oxidoreductase [Candidatus Puniceispirillaceae bacterium]
MPLADMLNGRLRLPLIAAPMFLASGPELVLACCRAGIIGSFPAKNQRTRDGLDAWLTGIGEGLAAIEAETGHTPPPYAVNLIVHRSNADLEDEIEMVVRHQVPIVITSLGAVPELVARVHGYGGIVFHDVINLRHARKAIGAGVDGLIAVAAGAGGHTGRASPFALVNEIRQAFDGMLMLSGAMSSGGDIAAAQVMGADLAYFGTRFIGTAECRSPEDYKRMLVDSQLGDIVETDMVSGINANFIAASLAAAGYSADGAPPDADIAGELAEAHDADRNMPTAWRDIWSAGHGVGGITDIPTVARLVDRLEREYHAALAAQQDRVAALATGAGSR